MKTLRPYQKAALTTTWKFVYQQGNNNALLVAPVGAGKSLMMAEWIRGSHMKWPNYRSMLVTHDKNLIEQNLQELHEQWPAVRAGIYCAGLKEKKLVHPVTFASIQSIHNKANLMPYAPNQILIDEAHLIPHNKSTQYRTFLDSVLSINPDCKIIGFTGTPFRSDSGLLCDGDDRLFDNIAYEIPITYLIENGYLCRPVLPDVTAYLDTTGVGTRAGDYISSQLQSAVNTDNNNLACVDEILNTSKDRKRILVFTAGIEHCENVTAILQSKGVDARMMHSNMTAGDIEKNKQDFKAGKCRVLVNVAMLTTGFNVPEIDCLVFMRPTKSPVLYIQMMGRGMRTAEGKLDCMVLDFGGVVAELGPIDNVEVKRKARRKQETALEVVEARVKHCPNCSAEMTGSQRFCYECGEDTKPSIALQAQAERNAHLLSSDIEPEEARVWGWTLSKHKKRLSKSEKDKIKAGEMAAPPPSMRVTYDTNLGQISEFVFFEHEGYALNEAQAWHDLHNAEYKGFYPHDVDFALHCHENGNPYMMPSKFAARKEGKYWRVDKASKDFTAPQSPQDHGMTELSF